MRRGASDLLRLEFKVREHFLHLGLNLAGKVRVLVPLVEILLPGLTLSRRGFVASGIDFLALVIGAIEKIEQIVDRGLGFFLVGALTDKASLDGRLARLVGIEAGLVVDDS